jgi:hypothetical protein
MTAFVAPNDQLAFWYVRVSLGGTVKSLISVAPLVGYWGGPYANPTSAQWKELWKPIAGAVLLDTLKKDIVPLAKGKAADFVR